MSTAPNAGPIVQIIRHEIDQLRDHWLSFTVLGIALVVVGALAIGAPQITALATVSVLGFLLIANGIMRFIGAFWAREWSGFFLFLLGALFSVILGLMFLRTPLRSIGALALMLACVLLVGGVFRIVTALLYRFPGWLWFLMGGVVNILLAALILKGWPQSSLAIIGLIVGLEMICDGWLWIALGLDLRRLPARKTA